MGKRFPEGSARARSGKTELVVKGRPVAEYVTEPEVDPLRGPRPYLHPVRTLAGTVVTDVLPEDHPHHLGVSVSMQDVNGTNLWGGRTYVRGSGYQWREDHGRIEHVRWLEQAPDRLHEELRWLDHDDGTLLIEERTMSAAPLDNAWRLDFAYTLTAAEPVTLGSPATNGREGKAGYGGFFWRLPMADTPPAVFNAQTDVEADVNGSTLDWVAISRPDFTLVFTGLGEGDHWFVRATEYPGVCVALAFEETRHLKPGDSLTRKHSISIVDGRLSRAQVEAMSGEGAEVTSS